MFINWRVIYDTSRSVFPQLYFSLPLRSVLSWIFISEASSNQICFFSHFDASEILWNVSEDSIERGVFVSQRYQSSSFSSCHSIPFYFSLWNNLNCPCIYILLTQCWILWACSILHVFISQAPFFSGQKLCKWHVSVSVLNLNNFDTKFVAFANTQFRLFKYCWERIPQASPHQTFWQTNSFHLLYLQ